MNMSLLSTYILSVILLLITPGPVVALITVTAARDGYRPAFATVAGTNAASLILIAFAALMLKGVVSLSPVWLSFTGLGGAVYIGYTALRELFSPPSSDAADTGTEVQRQGGFLQGLAIGLSNPKDILFFVSLFPQFIALTRDFTTSILTLSLIWVIFDFAILTLYILTVRRWMPARYGRKTGAVSALFLLSVAGCGVVYNILALTDNWH